MSSFVSGFTFNELAAVDPQKMILAKVFGDNKYLPYFSVYENIVAKEQIPFMGLLPIMGEAYKGCSPTRDSEGITSSEKFWNPEKIECSLELCADTYKKEITAWMLNRGINSENMDGTVILDWVEDRFGAAVLDSLLRHIWFGDTTAANYNDSPAGHITNAIDPKYVNVIDGLWKQLFTIGSGTPARRYTISKNSQGTYANQALGAGEAYTILDNLYTGADARLINSDGLVFMVTRSIYNNYLQYLESKNGGVEASYMLTQTGTRELSFRGIPVVNYEFWDRKINELENNATAWYLPHRAILTVPTQLAVGTGSMSTFNSFQTFYDAKTRTNGIDSVIMLDAKVMENYMIQIAY